MLKMDSYLMGSPGVGKHLNIAEIRVSADHCILGEGTPAPPARGWTFWYVLEDHVPEKHPQSLPSFSSVHEPEPDNAFRLDVP